MAMGPNSIMVGKSYRTPDDEIRTVQSIDNGEVVSSGGLRRVADI